MVTATRLHKARSHVDCQRLGSNSSWHCIERDPPRLAIPGLFSAAELLRAVRDVLGLSEDFHYKLSGPSEVMPIFTHALLQKK